VEARRDATIGDSEGHRGEFVIGSPRDEHDQFAGGFGHVRSPLRGLLLLIEPMRFACSECRRSIRAIWWSAVRSVIQPFASHEIWIFRQIPVRRITMRRYCRH